MRQSVLTKFECYYMPLNPTLNVSTELRIKCVYEKVQNIQIKCQWQSQKNVFR